MTRLAVAWLKTPDEIAARCDEVSLDPAPLVHASRTAANVDSKWTR